MKIGLNATCFNDRPSGARQRFVGIYGELFKYLPNTEFVIYEPSDCNVGSWFSGVSNISARRTPLQSEGRVSKLLGGISYWPSELRREKFDIFESFNQPVVKYSTGLTILTIHDIRRTQSDFSMVERIAYRLALERDLRASDHVITVSHSMKEELLKFSPSASISVIYNGLSAIDFDSVLQADLKNIIKKYDLPEEFVLAVGHFEKRKNYLNLIDAIALLRLKGNNQNLVIIGNDSGEGKAIAHRVQSENLTGQVKILSGLTDLEVRCMYKLCSLFVFPSSYEGFGIPIIEAMAAGCKMVLSDIPVFREITNNSAIFFRHDKASAIAEAIDLALTAKSESELQVHFGYKRIQAFNFKALASQLAELYKTMLKL